MGIDQCPEMLRSQTLQKKKYHMPRSRSVIKMNDLQVQYFLMLRRRLADILEHEVWPSRGPALPACWSLLQVEFILWGMLLPYLKTCGKQDLRSPSLPLPLW